MAKHESLSCRPPESAFRASFKHGPFEPTENPVLPTTHRSRLHPANYIVRGSSFVRVSGSDSAFRPNRFSKHRGHLSFRIDRIPAYGLPDRLISSRLVHMHRARTPLVKRRPAAPLKFHEIAGVNFPTSTTATPSSSSPVLCPPGNSSSPPFTPHPRLVPPSGRPRPNERDHPQHHRPHHHGQAAPEERWRRRRRREEGGGAGGGGAAAAAAADGGGSKKRELKGILTSLLLLEEQEKQDDQERDRASREEKQLFDTHHKKKAKAMASYYSNLEDYYTEAEELDRARRKKGRSLAGAAAVAGAVAVACVADSGKKGVKKGGRGERGRPTEEAVGQGQVERLVGRVQ
ncbi:hypothetical protein NL676_036075 [Syzygium grande]|nr:hypothetical protein NL676_036075 [Syzygium grande]